MAVISKAKVAIVVTVTAIFKGVSYSGGIDAYIPINNYIRNVQSNNNENQCDKVEKITVPNCKYHSTNIMLNSSSNQTSV